MGLFIQTAIIKNYNLEKIHLKLDELSNIESLNLIPEKCKYIEKDNDLLILFNEDCSGYERLAENLSNIINTQVLLLYIYDEDFWGYLFYENGKEIDCFNQIPDYFEDIDEEEKQKYLGDAKLIANYFNINYEDIQNYLKFLDEEEMEDEEGKAYYDDEYSFSDCWQMTDFMKKLGFPFEFNIN